MARAKRQGKSRIRENSKTPLPPERRSHEFVLNEYDAWQERQRGRNWTLGQVPFYRGKGHHAEHNPFDWHRHDFLKYYDQVYGRQCGAAGIGKLKDVGLIRVRKGKEADHPFLKEDPEFVRGAGLRSVDRTRLRDEQASYSEKLQQYGVKVYWIDFPEEFRGAYGPMGDPYSAGDLMFLPGGTIVPKHGTALASVASFGRPEYLARWVFWNLGLPPLVTINGKGVWAPGVFLADDVYCQAVGVGTNEDGLNQVVPKLKSVVSEKVQLLRILTPGWSAFDAASGISAFANDVIAPLDVDKVLVYPAGLDKDANWWLWDNGYKIVEVPHAEQVRYRPCNGVIIEPGLVAINAAAEETIRSVRKAGVEVVPVEYRAHSAGLASATMQIWREAGPRKFS
jgi:N-dimethylarginine dimethylaminohydrolase